MNEYKPQLPRALFATCAIALAAVTLAALVVAPAKLDSGFAPDFTLTAARKVQPEEVAISPARIDVVGVRAPDVAWALPDAGGPCKPSV